MACVDRGDASRRRSVPVLHCPLPEIRETVETVSKAKEKEILIGIKTGPHPRACYEQ